MTSDKTFNIKGEKQIDLVKSTRKKKRLTIVVGVTSKGEILPSLLIFKSEQKKKILIIYDSQCIVTHNKKGWMIREIYLAYLTSTLFNLTANDNNQVVLLHDAFSGHKEEQIDQVCNDNNVKVFILPAGSTFAVQVVDTHIGKVLKDKIRIYQKVRLEKEVNKQLNQEIKESIPSPSNYDMIQWCIQSIAQFQKDYIMKGFQHNGINLSLDKPLKEQLNPLLFSIDKIKDQLQEILKPKQESNPYSEKPQFQNAIKEIEGKDTYECTEIMEKFINLNFDHNLNSLSTEQENLLEENVYQKIDDQAIEDLDDLSE